MAVEALRDALKGAPQAQVNSLLFATTTPPYGEKLNAAIVGAAAQLPVEIRAADVTGSIRAGLSALLQGLESAQASGGYAAVAMADAGSAHPKARWSSRAAMAVPRSSSATTKLSPRSKRAPLSRASSSTVGAPPASASPIHGKNALP